MVTCNQSFLYSILLLLSIANLTADTIKLKDGTVLEGKVIKETPDSIDFEYNFTKSIKETKTIKRSDIKVIDKEEADEIALEEIKQLLPTASLLSTDDYDKILAGKPAAFMADFKTSKLKSSVQDIIDQLLAEKAKVAANSIKIDGKWITSEEALKDPYNHNALVLATRMRASIEERNYLSALTQFEKLEKEFEYSTAYTKSIDSILATLPKYAARLTQYKRNYPLRMAQRDKDLKSMEASDRAQTETAFQTQQKRFEQRVAEAKELKNRWAPVSEWNLPSISDNLDTVTKETERLEKLDLAKVGELATLIAGSYQDLADNKLTSAQSRLENAKSMGAKGEVITKLAEQIDTQRKAARAAALEAADDNEDKDNSGEAKETKPEKGNGKTSENKNTKKAPDKREPEVNPDNESANTTVTTEKESEGLSFQLLLSILAGVLLIVTLVAKFLVKSPEDDTD